MTALPSTISRWLWPGLAAAALAVLLAPWVISSSSDTPPPVDADWQDYTAAVNRGAFTVDLLLDARLEAGQSVTLSSALPSNMANILELAPDGAFLRAGELVARFDRLPIEQAIRQVTSDIRDLETQLEQMRADLDLMRREGDEKTAQIAYKVELAAKEREQLLNVDLPANEARAERDFRKIVAAHEEARQRFDTQQQLFAKGMVAARDLAKTESEWRQIDAEYAIAASELEGYRRITLPAERRHADLKLANSQRELSAFEVTLEQRLQKQAGSIQRTENKLRKLEEQLAESEHHLTLTDIRAPVTGILLHRKISAGLEKRKPQVGDSLWNRHAFAVIPDMSSMMATAAVSEREVGRLAVGQPVRLSPDAYPSLRLEGAIEAVGSLVESDTGDPRFEVRIAITDADERLRPGMSARAEVRTAELADALRVPVQGVFVEDMQTIAFVARGRNVTRVPVALGPSDGRHVVVEEGLSQGDEILLVHPDSLQ